MSALVTSKEIRVCSRYGEFNPVTSDDFPKISIHFVARQVLPIAYLFHGLVTLEEIGCHLIVLRFNASQNSDDFDY